MKKLCLQELLELLELGEGARPEGAAAAAGAGGPTPFWKSPFSLWARVRVRVGRALQGWKDLSKG